MKEDWKERLETLLQKMVIEPSGKIKSDSYEAEFCRLIKEYRELRLDVMPYIRRYDKLCGLALNKKR